MNHQQGSFDLFSAKIGRKAETVLVITPYVEREFFDQLLAGLRPKWLHVVIDDGCRSDDAQMVSEATAEAPCKTKLACVLGSAPGLVHLKLFFIVWRTDGGRAERTLIFGSANATRQGFAGSINAELIATCRLTKAKNSSAIDWCERVVAATSARAPVVVEAARDLLVGDVSVRLPRILIGKSRATISNFDLWVQRGYLLAGYRPEPGFLKVPVHLKRSLGETEQSRIVASTGFEVPPARRLTHSYVGRDGLLEEDEEFADDGREGVINWRSRFFTWTQLGYWCSEQCHAEHRELFRRRGCEEREQQLQKLSHLQQPAAAEESRRAFVDTLVRVWKGLGTEASSFLEGSHSLDEDHYENVFDRRLRRDLELAEDCEFRDRYITGFEIAQVPRFRTDLRGWREFLSSIARQICLDHARPRPQSLLLHSVREAIEKAEEPSSALDSSGKLLTFLSQVWVGVANSPRNMSAPASVIEAYHRRGSIK